MVFHGTEQGEGEGFFFSFTYVIVFSHCGIKDLWSWGKTDLKKKTKKKLLIRKCLSSVHLQSIVEKEEIFINGRSANQVGSQFFSSAFTSFFSSFFSSVSFFSSFSSEALSFTVRSPSFSATVFALSLSSVAKDRAVSFSTQHHNLEAQFITSSLSATPQQAVEFSSEVVC